jgi:hypothetical protein
MANQHSTHIRRFEIAGRGDGRLYGVYKGATAEDAVQALLDDAGSDEAPNMDAWHVREVSAVQED